MFNSFSLVAVLPLTSSRQPLQSPFLLSLVFSNQPIHLAYFLFIEVVADKGPCTSSILSSEAWYWYLTRGHPSFNQQFASFNLPIFALKLPEINAFKISFGCQDELIMIIAPHKSANRIVKTNGSAMG
jgi:hypothetical protein